MFATARSAEACNSGCAQAGSMLDNSPPDSVPCKAPLRAAILSRFAHDHQHAGSSCVLQGGSEMSRVYVRRHRVVVSDRVRLCQSHVPSRKGIDGSIDTSIVDSGSFTSVMSECCVWGLRCRQNILKVMRIVYLSVSASAVVEEHFRQTPFTSHRFGVSPGHLVV